MERDSFVDAVFKATDLPIIHVSARATYNPREIEQQIVDALGQNVNLTTPSKQIPTPSRAVEQNAAEPGTIGHLWVSGNSSEWDSALERYWEFVQPKHLELERSLDKLDLKRIERLDADGWYEFLRAEYFRWKYTAANRYATTTRYLAEYKEQPGGLEKLYMIKRRLLSLNPENAVSAMGTAREIKGLGAAGASGLLAIMYPAAFGTVDQFVVKALRSGPKLQEADAVAKMKPESLTNENAVVLTTILRRKAAENNQAFGSSNWTPRKIDKVLWTYGRE